MVHKCGVLHTDIRCLNATQLFPAFNPMAIHIQDNTAAPVANQVGRLKLEPNDILTIPH